VYADPGDVPLHRIVEAGIPVALGADDPLLFGSRLAAQYTAARDLGFDDAGLARLARGSLEGSRMPDRLRKAALADVDTWLAGTA
jgi:adenosine deaminase